MRITYLSLAVQDLMEIRGYIAAQNPDTAQLVGRKLTDILNGLKQFPNLGKPGRVFGTCELNTPKIGKATYLVVYRVKRDEIQILALSA